MQPSQRGRHRVDQKDPGLLTWISSGQLGHIVLGPTGPTCTCAVQGRGGGTRGVGWALGSPPCSLPGVSLLPPKGAPYAFCR